MSTKSTEAECAEVCKYSSTMFAFGSDKYGGEKCQGGTCMCECQRETDGANCNTIKYNKGFNLYRINLKFKGDGKSMKIRSFINFIAIV